MAIHITGKNILNPWFEEMPTFYSGYFAETRVLHLQQSADPTGAAKFRPKLEPRPGFTVNPIGRCSTLVALCLFPSYHLVNVVHLLAADMDWMDPDTLSGPALKLWTNHRVNLTQVDGSKFALH